MAVEGVITLEFEKREPNQFTWMNCLVRVDSSTWSHLREKVERRLGCPDEKYYFDEEYFVLVGLYDDWTPAFVQAKRGAAAPFIRAKKLLQSALGRGVSQVIAVHHYVEWDCPEPTDIDIATLRQLMDASRSLGMIILDYLLVSRDNSQRKSMRERSILPPRNREAPGFFVRNAERIRQTSDRKDISAEGKIIVGNFRRHDRCEAEWQK